MTSGGGGRRREENEPARRRGVEGRSMSYIVFQQYI